LLIKANLALPRCPHCKIAQPLLESKAHAQSNGTGGHRTWYLYTCSVCGGGVLAAHASNIAHVVALYPFGDSDIAAAVIGRARDYLLQARDSIGQPMASIVMSAGAVDAMLKEKGLSKGNLYDRIDKAAADHLITADMAKWAHQVRLDANDQRHADASAPLPKQEDAQRCFDFAIALAEVLYVLPSRVTRGIEVSKPPQ
jgi:Domain of unknown function (DUF4145)